MRDVSAIASKVCLLTVAVSLSSGCATTRAGATIEEVVGVTVGSAASLTALVAVTSWERPFAKPTAAISIPVALLGGALFFHGIYVDLQANEKRNDPVPLAPPHLDSTRTPSAQEPSTKYVIRQEARKASEMKVAVLFPDDRRAVASDIFSRRDWEKVPLRAAEYLAVIVANDSAEVLNDRFESYTEVVDAAKQTNNLASSVVHLYLYKIGALLEFELHSHEIVRSRANGEGHEGSVSE
jgi:hypothetical protein